MGKTCNDCGMLNDTPEEELCSDCFFESEPEPLYLSKRVEELAQEHMELTGQPVADMMNHILETALARRVHQIKLQRTCDHKYTHEHKNESWCSTCQKYLGVNYKK
jgi:hypothetical protein